MTTKSSNTSQSNSGNSAAKPKNAGNKHKSLCSLLRYFVGLELTVELKAGRLFSGILQDADQQGMNLTLENATVLTPSELQKKNNRTTNTSIRRQKPEAPHLLEQQETQEQPSAERSIEESSSPSSLSLMQIRGSSIRYIHFSGEDNLTAIIKQGMDRERAAAQKYKRGIRK